MFCVFINCLLASFPFSIISDSSCSSSFICSLLFVLLSLSYYLLFCFCLFLFFLISSCSRRRSFFDCPYLLLFVFLFVIFLVYSRSLSPSLYLFMFLLCLSHVHNYIIMSFIGCSDLWFSSSSRGWKSEVLSVPSPTRFNGAAGSKSPQIRPYAPSDMNSLSSDMLTFTKITEKWFSGSNSLSSDMLTFTKTSSSLSHDSSIGLLEFLGFPLGSLWEHFSDIRVSIGAPLEPFGYPRAGARCKIYGYLSI